MKIITTYITTIIIALVTLQTTHARINDTRAEAAKRYGEPFNKRTDGTHNFKVGKIIISAWFDANGKCDSIAFENVTNEQSVEIINKNFPQYKGKWNEVKKDVYEKNGNKVMFDTDKVYIFSKRFILEEAQKDKNKVKGF